MSTAQHTQTDPETGSPVRDAAVGKGASRKAPSAFRTISEVADELDVQQHVLRFWETKFSQIKPLKRGGGRRYYRPEDVVLLQKIHHLLYTEGYTIKGVQKLLREQGKAAIVGVSVTVPAAPVAEKAVPKAASQPVAAKEAQSLSPRQRVILESMLGDLKDLRDLIKGE